MIPGKIKYHVERTAKGLDTIVVSLEGRESPLHSKMSPEREADLFRDRFDPVRYDLLIVLGVGLGYHLIPLQELLKDYAQIVLIDIMVGLGDAILRNPLTSFLVTSERVTLIEGRSAEAVQDILTNSVNMDLIKGVSVIEHPASLRIFGDYYLDVRKAIEKVVNRKAGNAATRRAFGSRYVRNIFFNFSRFDSAFPVRSLFGAFAGFPAVIACSGPSLDDDIAAMVENRDRYFLVAVDSALPPVLHAGLRPDIVVSIDPQPYVKEHFIGCDVGKIIRVSSISSHPFILESARGFISLNTHPFSQFADGVYEGSIGSIDSSTGSVAGDAVNLCLKCGFSAIGVTGLDFSFSKFMIYARGTAYQRRYALLFQNRFATVEGRNLAYIMKASGGMRHDGRYTRRSFLHYRMALEDFLKREGSERVFAVNDRGIVPAGMRFLQANEFFELHCRERIERSERLEKIRAGSGGLGAAFILSALQNASNDRLFGELLEASLGKAIDDSAVQKYRDLIPRP